MKTWIPARPAGAFAPISFPLVLWAGVLSATTWLGPLQVAAQTAEEPSDVAVDQLRHAHGRWDVTTTFFHENGVDSTSVGGRYDFEWVVPDRVLMGVSTIPLWNRASAVLFFVRPSSREVEMASVSDDGVLWRMIGPDTSETRTTVTPLPDGTEFRARFTRYEVTPDRFRSVMERSTDGGDTWRVVNRQLFRRVNLEGPDPRDPSPRPPEDPSPGIR